MAKRDNFMAECDISGVAAVFAGELAYLFGAKP
jgi:hypothetical protein